jgi:hypothetical protein
LGRATRFCNFIPPESEDNTNAKEASEEKQCATHFACQPNPPVSIESQRGSYETSNHKKEECPYCGPHNVRKIVNMFPRIASVIVRVIGPSYFYEEATTCCYEQANKGAEHIKQKLLL